MSEKIGEEESLYFLVERVRINRINPEAKDGYLYVEIRPVSISKLKTKAIADVTDENGDIIYQVELNSRFFKSELFRRLFKSHYIDSAIPDYNSEMSDFTIINRLIFSENTHKEY